MLDILLLIPLLFLLPLFPFTIVTNRFIFSLDRRVQVFVILAAFTAGSWLLSINALAQKLPMLEIVATLSALFYAFRMLSVENILRYLLFYYSVLSAMVWQWKSVGGDIGDFVLMILPAMMAFGMSVYVLITRFKTLHTKVISGLGHVMPRLSVFFILSLLALQFTPLLYGFELLSRELVHLSFLGMFSQAAGWLLLNWGGFRLIEQIIYGKTVRHYRYRDLGNTEMALLAVLLLGNVLFFIYYAGRTVG